MESVIGLTDSTADLTQYHGAENYRLVIDGYAAVAFASQVFLQNHISRSELSYFVVLHLNLNVPGSNYKELTYGRIVPG